MGSADRIQSVARRIRNGWVPATIVVVPSAMTGDTNRLIALAKDISPDVTAREVHQ